MSKLKANMTERIISDAKNGQYAQLSSSAFGASTKQRSNCRMGSSGIFVESAHSKKANISQTQANRAVKSYLSGK